MHSLATIFASNKLVDAGAFCARSDSFPAISTWERAMASADDVPLDDKAKRTRDLLSSFYSPDDGSSPARDAPTSAPVDDINSPSFDPDLYINHFVSSSFSFLFSSVFLSVRDIVEVVLFSMDHFLRDLNFLDNSALRSPLSCNF